VQPLPHGVLVPLVASEELLGCAWRNAGGQGDRFDALLGEVGELTVNVDDEMLPRVTTGKAVREARQLLLEPRLEGLDVNHVHAKTS
jgi:hypothetical protein